MRIASGSAKLHVERLGDGDKPVVLLHGLGGSGATWCDIPAALSRSRRVIVPDLRGCGRSERGTEPYTFDVLARDVTAVLDALSVTDCHLVGHSLGGVVAQQVLTTQPQRCASAVLVSTSSLVGERAAQAWRRLADSVARRGLKDQTEAVGASFAVPFARSHPDVLRTLTEAANAADPGVYSEQARIAAEYDLTDALGRVNRPILVIQGEADQLTGPGGSVILSRACPGARLTMVPGAGHSVHLEMGEAFVELIERFFDDTEAAGHGAA